ncbi:hypothetical protein FOPG_17145 [Fusarium oxysporum f. sp. conglutinans race 2 54008]|uniref:Uncharacterized protein n=1 Tax=Fusarium oxysporum f. sp. conglutinans race 2 54008 TaxID=1089457 RepID=X0H3X0_FUSOX|nr:hypothetical protein FOPG_17145 [Fusarium oxysporum f. sp. conglutinans race 2 54008]
MLIALIQTVPHNTKQYKRNIRKHQPQPAAPAQQARVAPANPPGSVAQPTAQQITVPANRPPTDQDMADADNASQDSNNSEVKQLREQLGNVTNEINEMR